MTQNNKTGPPTLLPPDIEKFGVDVYYDAKKAVKDVDIFYNTFHRSPPPICDKI